jgi:elongation factor 1 alpha-like protein
LAAARKKRESEKNATNSATGSGDKKLDPSLSQKTATLSLHDRLAGHGEHRSSGNGDARLKLGRSGRIKSESPPKDQVLASIASKGESQSKLDVKPKSEESTPEMSQMDDPTLNADVRAPPSMFAAVMVGEASTYRTREPSHLSSSVNVMEIFGQNVTEAFNFAGPSPDDIALNARNPTKGSSLANGGGKVS